MQGKRLVELTMYFTERILNYSRFCRVNNYDNEHLPPGNLTIRTIVAPPRIEYWFRVSSRPSLESSSCLVPYIKRCFSTSTPVTLLTLVFSCEIFVSYKNRVIISM